jgi:hypothetical protein
VFEKTLHIPHTEQFRDEWRRYETLQIVEMFSDTQKDDWRLGRRDAANENTHDGQDHHFQKTSSAFISTTVCADSRRDRSTSLGVPVQLGNDDRPEIRTLLERPALPLCRLTDRGVEYHDRHVLQRNT